MKIRSITWFCDPHWPLDSGVFKQAGDFILKAREAFEGAGYEVQTTRLATVPFSLFLPQMRPGELVKLAQDLEKASKECGYDYVSLGPAFPDGLNNFDSIPEALAGTLNAFFSGVMADKRSGISLPAIRACARVIHKASTISPDGFANLRFAALANVTAGSPFFPASYHDYAEPAFALAIEAADLAVEAFIQADSLEEARQSLIHAVEMHAQAMQQVADHLMGTFSVNFGGIDFSLAPFPVKERSLGAAFEALGIPAIGLHGSLTAAAFITEALDRARFKRAGFCGLFLPVLEDAVLALRASEGILTLKDLLLYSAVCGTGLDTIPLPGDVREEQLAAILLDLAALALRLDKPLTARLMPIPGKKAGDPTSFDFSYFANSRVMAIEARALQGLFNGDEAFILLSR
jgi:uncharacterized protein (UPF0210 family)